MDITSTVILKFVDFFQMHLRVFLCLVLIYKITTKHTSSKIETFRKSDTAIDIRRRKYLLLYIRFVIS